MTEVHAQEAGLAPAEPKPTADQLAAHDLLSELRTRIATQPLPYQHGIEASALQSLWQIFEFARKAMKDHPGCSRFAHDATDMLNTVLRPVTAKWHRAHEAGLLNSRDGANEFRADLQEVRLKLVAFAEHLQQMAYGSAAPDKETPPVLSLTEIDDCFRPLVFGLDEGAPTAVKAQIKQINSDERHEVLARRIKHQIARDDKDATFDAIGLALSGGGIRSATFCLGVVQTLAERNLMKHVDYMSTVSGGGYIGSFISSLIGQGRDFSTIAVPYGPDTDPIRHLRQNAKYLSVVDLGRRWALISGTVAGLLLNWMAPLFVLSALSLIAVTTIGTLSPEFWWSVSVICGVLTGVAILLYGCTLQFGAIAWIGSALLSTGAGLTAFFAIICLMEFGFQKFNQLLQSHWQVSSVFAFLIIAAPATARFLPALHSIRVRRYAVTASLYAAGLLVPIIALTIFYLLRELGNTLGDTSFSPFNPLHYTSGWTLLWILTGISGVFSVFFLNVNLTGPHKLYRDQLASTFIWPAENRGSIPLSSLNAEGTAPYHLINAAVNLPSSTSAVLRDRKADFFLLSKHWTGSHAVGYVKTAQWYANARGEIDLATAMAISGAAASPHMGLSSKPTLSALMTLLNLRLGFWLPKPPSRPLLPPGFGCLMKEMTGLQMSERQAWLNVSDGGHIENMGIYELLRRRCKYIICVDGEADPQSTFAGQLTLVRHAQVDLGVRIEPRLDEIRQDPQSHFSRTHAQLFRIHYPRTEDGRSTGLGLLLYLKLSLTGDEAELLKRYRSLNPEFPHQSTVDQFYDEEQFEAYRQLGVHVAEGTFSPALMTRSPDPVDISDWFRQLAGSLLEASRI